MIAVNELTRKPIMTNNRTLSDSFGPIQIPAGVLWGAATARSRQFFAIGEQCMPLTVIHALAWLKWAAALVNGELNLLPLPKAQAIAAAAGRVAAGEFDAEFPLSLWQTGSGTQSNMNVNEVLAMLATRTLQAAQAGSNERPPESGANPATISGPTPANGTNGMNAANGSHAGHGAAQSVAGVTVHPNDDVNLGQSSNDVFPSAMHLALALQARQQLLPALQELRATIAAKGEAFAAIIKLGRTHLQDATPLTFGQEFGGYGAQLGLCQRNIEQALPLLHALAIGGTAVGTGLNTHPEFGSRVVARLAKQLALPLRQADNLFAAMAGHEALVAFHGGLKMLALALIKIGNDLRLMGSGPRAGLGELHLPENEPGSSIMPGKVNPTQIEALCMVCAQVIGHDAAICFAATQGQFELNVYKPLLVYNALDSVRLLSDAMHSVSQNCVAGIEVNQGRVTQLLESSLMLVTALTPHIGYARAAQIAQYAQQHETTLRAAALALGTVSGEQFDLWVDPHRMLGPAA